jgi:outer membrane protein assembly factor BamB
MKRDLRVWVCGIGAAAGLAGSVAASESDAAALLKATGIRGGLCLVAGAKDMALADELAAGSALYVQVLQPEAKRAAAWGAEVAGSPNRESIGVRTAAFDPSHYGSCLFNLIVLNDAKDAAGAKIAPELTRILAPGGALALAGKNASLDSAGSPQAGLAKAGLLAAQGPDGWVCLKKAPGPVGKAGPSDSLRWRAGSRWQRIMAHDFQSVTFGAGKLVYREAMAGSNGLHRFEMHCRDAYNGRLLWKIEEELFSDKDWAGQLRGRMGLAIGENGRIYTGLGRDLVCLDADTGKVLSTLKPGGRPGQVLIHRNQYLLADGRMLDLAEGRELGRYPGGSMAVAGDVVYSSGEGRAFTASRIPDGKTLWQVTPTNHPGGQYSGLFCSDTALHVRRSWPAATLTTMDLATGQMLWAYPPEPRPKVRDVLAYPFGDRLYVAYSDAGIAEPHDFVFKGVEAATGKVLRDRIFAPGRKWAGGCWGPRPAGDYMLYHHNLWLDLKTAERTYLAMFRPKCDQGPLPAYGMIYGFPGRKGGAIKGIAGLAPRDMEFSDRPGGQELKTHAAAPEAAPAARADEWPMFRGNPARGNTSGASPGKTLTLKWQATVGLGRQTYAAMDAQRTGLSQAVCAGGLAAVADIEGQRVVALDPETGAIRWAFHVGSRVDFPPALHEGLCLFSAKDGWAYCLDAKTGGLIYRLLIAPQERYIGGEETIQSMWPGCGDVLVAEDLAYASAGLAASIHGGIRVVAFKPRTGEVVWSREVQGRPAVNDGEVQPSLMVWDAESKRVLAAGKALDSATGKDKPGRGGAGCLRPENFEDWLATNNRNRLSEDQGNAALEGGGVGGRMIAFSDTFGVGFSVPRIEKAVFHVGPLNIAGRSCDGKVKWTMPPTELNVDDFVVTSEAVYMVGHYEKGEGAPELWAVSSADGSVLSTLKLGAFPAYNGLSAAGNKLFVATRDGRLICFGGK